MHRFFSPSQNIALSTIIITAPQQLRHIRAVLRLKVEDKVIIFDENNKEYSCVIKELAKDKVILEIMKKLKTEKFSQVKITVACAIPKKAKMDEIIDKLVQLGVDRIIPIMTERVIVKFDKNKQTQRLQRWKKIALGAAQQSQRKTLPVIEPIKELKEALEGAQDFDLRLIPHLAGERKPLKEILGVSIYKNILVLIGPEGDFTPEEVSWARESGFIPVSLGDLVLRVDTAAIFIASVLNYAYL